MSNCGLLVCPAAVCYNVDRKGSASMNGNIFRNLREKHGLTQEQLAERVFVTRQAVSRWENGETIPNVDTLKLLSALYNVSINTLLGSPRRLICQCCGMPMEDDSVLSREPDDSFNESYCKWCYTDGEFVYKTLDELLDFLVAHMSGEHFSPDDARTYFAALLPKLNHWKD